MVAKEVVTGKGLGELRPAILTLGVPDMVVVTVPETVVGTVPTIVVEVGTVPVIEVTIGLPVKPIGAPLLSTKAIP
jgi:hypothetical protein